MLSFPWIGFTLDPQWERVHLVPLTGPGDKPRDMIANFILFVPFGYSVARRRLLLPGLARAAGLAAVVSFSAEAMQVFSTERYPSGTDLSVAILGALAGAGATFYSRRQSKGRPWTN